MIPCIDSCRWQQDGVCTLDTCDNAIGQPSASHTLASIMCLLSPSQQLQRPGDIRHRKKLQTNGCLQIFDLVSWHHAFRKA